MRSITLAVTLLIASAALADTFTVTREDDGAGTGTLRWAIEQANATPEGDTIRFVGAKIIRPMSPLPEVTAPLSINGSITIDGTNAGNGAGLVLDHSLLSYLNVQNFAGDGVVLRTSSRMEFCVVTGNATGVRVTGSDNAVYGARIADNREAGVVVTAPASRNNVGRFVYACQILCPPQAGANTIVGNGGDGIVVAGDNNVIDANFVGADFREASANGGDGIRVSGKGNTVQRNTVSYNRGNGLTLTSDVVWDSNSGACNAGVFVATSTPRPPAPRIISAVNDATAFSVSGEILGNPDTEYTIEFHALPSSCDGTSLPNIIGSRIVKTDARGTGTFNTAFTSYSEVPYVAALAVDRVTSEHPVAVAATSNHDRRADLEVTGNSIDVIAGASVAVRSVITNHGPAAIGGAYVPIPTLANMQSSSVQSTKGFCYTSCSIDALAAGESATITHSVRFLKPGVYHYKMSVTENSGGVGDPSSGNNQSDVTINVHSAHPRPAGH